MNCPKCNGERVVKNGKDRLGYQTFLCKNPDCKHSFAPDKPPLERELKESNKSRREHHSLTYLELNFKIRRDTQANLVNRMEMYMENNPGKGELQKKMLSILDEHFPNGVSR